MGYWCRYFLLLGEIVVGVHTFSGTLSLGAGVNVSGPFYHYHNEYVNIPLQNSQLATVFTQPAFYVLMQDTGYQRLVRNALRECPFL